MQLTIMQILDLVGSQAFGLRGALRDLHGIAKVVRNAKGEPLTDDKGVPIIEPAPYEFAAGARMKIALMLNKLIPHAVAFDEERQDLVRTYRAKQREKDEACELDEKSSHWPEFNKALTELTARTVTVEKMPKLTEADLRVDHNKIPQGTLAALVPVLELEA